MHRITAAQNWGRYLEQQQLRFLVGNHLGLITGRVLKIDKTLGSYRIHLNL